MEGLKSTQLQRYEDLFETIKGFRTRYFSDMSKRLYSLLLLEKLRVAIEEVEYYIEKGQTELLMNVGVDFSYIEISNDRRWEIKEDGQSLMVPNKERSTYHLLGDNVITAEYIKNEMTKPVVSYIAGRTAPPGKRMGHAGAIIQGNSGTVESKTKALNGAGVEVAKMPSEIVDLLKKEI